MSTLSENLKKIKKCCPKPAAVFLAIGIFSLLLQIAFAVSVPFADWYNRYPGAFFRMLFAKLTGWLPFSLAEMLFMALPALLVFLLVVIIRTGKKPVSEMVRLIFILLSVLSFFLSSFSLGFAAGYRGSTLDKKLSLDRREVTVDELKGTAILLRDEIEKMLPAIHYGDDGSSDMPYSLKAMNRVLQKDYAAASKRYRFLPKYRTTVKPIILSKWLTYTHISGVYTYFTGESNINTHFPDFTIPYTAAHELAHQRGVAREDEANFTAFLICKDSDDVYVRYSGYLEVFDYLLSALTTADRTAAVEIVQSCDARIIGELLAYNRFFARYEDNIAASVSGVINDTYLKSQGQRAGSRSYDLVVDLTVAYYRNQPVGTAC